MFLSRTIKTIKPFIFGSILFFLGNCPHPPGQLKGLPQRAQQKHQKVKQWQQRLQVARTESDLKAYRRILKKIQTTRRRTIIDANNFLQNKIQPDLPFEIAPASKKGKQNKTDKKIKIEKVKINEFIWNPFSAPHLNLQILGIAHQKTLNLQLNAKLICQNNPSIAVTFFTPYGQTYLAGSKVILYANPQIKNLTGLVKIVFD
jgi:hypothetical protein